MSTMRTPFSASMSWSTVGESQLVQIELRSDLAESFVGHHAGSDKRLVLFDATSSDDTGPSIRLLATWPVSACLQFEEHTPKRIRDMVVVRLLVVLEHIKMKYINFKGTVLPFRDGAMTTVHRDLNFMILDPPKWDTLPFLDLIYRRCGGIVELVRLNSTYRNPETNVLYHCYRISMRVKHEGSKAGWAFPIGKVNGLIHDLESEMESTLNVRFTSRHCGSIGM